MKNIIAALVLLTALTSLAGKNGCVFSCSLPDKSDLTFEINFDEKDQWNSSTTEPPLSPKKAKDLAVDFLKRDPFGYKMTGWSVSEIRLSRESGDKKTEYWVYVITFEDKQDKISVEGIPNVIIPVRMDGSIPKPKIRKPEETK